MKGWVLSQEGDQWSVRFDVRDLGGHLDTTFRGWSSTLVWSSLVWFLFLPSLLTFMVGSVWFGLCIFPPHFMVLRLLFLPLTACANFDLLFIRWSGLVVNLWLDPAFCVVWFRFRLLRRYLALWAC